MAQWAALRVGADRLSTLTARLGKERVVREMAALQSYSRALMRATLAALPSGP
jgi:N-methylhydantoinase B/oxoprolinase/acetone carboxylase alpha subunit